MTQFDYSMGKDIFQQTTSRRNLLNQLEKKLPEKVHVEKDRAGRLRISKDFWHALKELIKADDIILTLENGRGQMPEISEDHWRAIQSRLESDGLLSASPSTSTEDLDRIIDKSISRSWGNWLVHNEDNLKKVVSGIAITREEFMGLLREETKSYQRQIRQELEGMETRTKKIVQELTKLRDSATKLGGTTKEEIEALVKTTVRKVIENRNLDAIANGQIKGHASDILFNQVNFFGKGSGAIIDPTYTSSAWKIPKNQHKTKKWWGRDGFKPQPRAAALLDWSQEGECFCAGPDLRGHGVGTNNMSVLTSRYIIPQHLVVEHMLPGGTLDAGAMPREIEVWASFEEVNLRREVSVFSQENFPNTPTEVVLSENFVKIGHFVYENKDYGDGVQVFKMSDQLVAMKAITCHIVVRAINNYGADHTCFYRLRMYGDIVEWEEDPKPLFGGMDWF